MGFKKIFKKVLDKRRTKKFSKFTVLNRDVSILSNCCIGGAMYHDLGLQFESPTINLYFSHHGFIDYVNNLDRYILNGTIVDSKKREKSNNAPIGILICEGLPSIEIHFLHYTSFEEAKAKWIDRTKRINLNKIYLVIEAKDDHEHALLDEYASLPYKKIIFTNQASNIKKSIIHMPFYDKHPNGNITSFEGFCGKKGYDAFNFVEHIFNNTEW